MEPRLKLIHDAAAALFISKGYSRTKSEDIAREIGLSTGMLYKYFRGKQDILNFILKCSITPDFMEQEFKLPIGAGEFPVLEQEIMTALDFTAREFRRKLPAARLYPFEAMVSEAFDIIARYGVGMLLIEQNPDELPALANYYKEYRQQFFRNVVSYLNIYMGNGSVRELEHPEYSAQLIIETVSCWATRLMHATNEIPNDIPSELAKAVCMDNLLHAYLR